MTETTVVSAASSRRGLRGTVSDAKHVCPVTQAGFCMLTFSSPKHAISHIACACTGTRDESRASFEHGPERLEPHYGPAQAQPESIGRVVVHCTWLDSRGWTSVARERALSCSASRARFREATGLEELSTAVRAGLLPAVMVQDQYPRDFVVAWRRQLLRGPAS